MRRISNGKLQQDMDSLGSERCVHHAWVNEKRVLALLGGRQSVLVVWESGDQAQVRTTSTLAAVCYCHDYGNGC